ncbi:hypothetical protein HMPREF1275_01060 [Propionibacterium sp. KPL1844]|nr:hypothetical protein HMPREF1275_01060 [Propionibacterium sp. KPL1844]
MHVKTVATYVVCGILSAAAGVGGTVLYQYRDDELHVNCAGMATYFAEAISTPDTIDNYRVQDLIAPNTGWDSHSKKAEAWGHAIYKAFNTDSAIPNDGILITEESLPEGGVDIYSRVTGEPIMTVMMTPVDGKGWLVDWNATVRANTTPLPPLPSYR